jgi:hypothetical protein
MSKLSLTVLCLLGLFSAGCSSAGSAPAGDAARLRVTLRDYKGGRRFELVSESHTSRVDYYSEARGDAARKFQSDKVMALLVEELDKQGFDEHEQEGRAPSAGGELITWGLEVQTGDRTRHWIVGRGSAFEDLTDFGECREAFLQLYNVTDSYQAIENPGGKQIFEKPPQGRT